MHLVRSGKNRIESIALEWSLLCREAELNPSQHSQQCPSEWGKAVKRRTDCNVYHVYLHWMECAKHTVLVQSMVMFVKYYT